MLNFEYELKVRGRTIYTRGSVRVEKEDGLAFIVGQPILDEVSDPVTGLEIVLDGRLEVEFHAALDDAIYDQFEFEEENPDYIEAC